MDWSQRKVTHAARKPPNITHSVRIAVNTGGGKGQCYSKRKKEEKTKERRKRKQKQPKIIKKGERGEDEKIAKKIPNPNYKIPKKNLS